MVEGDEHVGDRVEEEGEDEHFFWVALNGPAEQSEQTAARDLS